MLHIKLQKTQQKPYSGRQLIAQTGHIVDRITASEVFISIVERGSMVGAAQALGMSRSMVTRYLSQMEDWAGTQLLHRSTRKLKLTAAGQQVLEQTRQLLDVAEAVPQTQAVNADSLQGAIRISCSQGLAQSALILVIQQYQQQHPKVSIDLHISNEAVNLVEQRIDLALRITNTLDPNIIARPLGRCDSVLCAAPSYLEQHGSPLNIEDLSQHNCLIYSNFGKQNLWQFSKGEEETAVPVSGTLSANESMLLLQACVDGMGIGHQPRDETQPYLDSGVLIELLPEYQPLSLGIYGIYRSRKNQPPALRAMLYMLVEHFQAT